MSRSVLTYDRAVAVTKSDTTVLDCKGFYVGGAGNVAIQTRGTTGIADGSADTAVTLTAIIPGTIYPIACYRIMSTNTSASAIVALY